MDYHTYDDFHVTPRELVPGTDAFEEPWPLASRYPADLVESDGGEL
ncbi:hypothetical protein N8I74_06620 [Chitiniphilus purpureus]|uniref:Uncharacterized protein n=1 Tax=Chitiniphilus purpureus TaxID=2981137 RepID=A0ABY6DQN6_9NEIS|nr:hypothetical protein [Chitiniphilus sp. CD1]UXY16689.1 hypothetical protein N8I74_06620 [Chitiniphilus sp. CD1]